MADAKGIKEGQQYGHYDEAIYQREGQACDSQADSADGKGLGIPGERGSDYEREYPGAD